MFKYKFKNGNYGEFFTNNTYMLYTSNEGDAYRKWKLTGNTIFCEEEDDNDDCWYRWSDGNEETEIIRLINDYVYREILGANDE